MADDAKNPHELKDQRALGQQVRLIAVIVLVLITIALVLDNRFDVRIGWVFGDTTSPLALVLIVTFILGLAVGWLGARRGRD